jgi:hypothetical protein
MIMDREYLERVKLRLQERLDETMDPQMRSFYQESLESLQSQLDQLAAEEQRGYEDPKMPEYRLLHQGEPSREKKHCQVVIAGEEPLDEKCYRVVRVGQYSGLVQDQQEEGDSQHG